MGLRFLPSANESHYIDLLRRYTHSQGPSSPFEVYTKETMPNRYHFTNNDRIAPIYLVPKLGWIIANHREESVVGGSGRPKGVSNLSYDATSLLD
jgi:hypothetical protein